MEQQHQSHGGSVTHGELKQTLTTWQLWGIAVGLVISVAPPRFARPATHETGV